MSAMLTGDVVEAVAAAVFDGPDAWVAEAYSDLDVLPREFATASAFVSYARQRLSRPRGSASFFVTYSDMGGRAVRQTIQLSPGSVPGHTLRYTWQGWGLISVQLTRGDQPNDASRVSANSEKRALKWESTYPEWESPATWTWKAVESHARRLQRVLKRAAG